MGKVDWSQAEADYVTQKSVSYGGIAKKFGVAKSTIVRHAKREKWPIKRIDYARRLVATLEAKTLEKRADVEARELKLLRMVMGVTHKEILRLGLKQQAGEVLTTAERRGIADLTGSLSNVIMAERKILGLSSKAVRISDEEAVENIQIAMGIIPDPAEKNRQKELSEINQSLERMIERKKMIQEMIDESNDRGAY